MTIQKCGRPMLTSGFSILLGVIVSMHLASSPIAGAKRKGVPGVQPVVLNNLKVQTRREESQNEVILSLEAMRPSESTPVWKTELYRFKLDPQLEADVQDIAVTRLRIEGSRLKVEDSRGRTFAVDSDSGKLLRVEP